jgi:hypothetical protein
VSPATDGVYRYVLTAGVPVRFDSVGTAYGADNHVPQISADGDTVVWASSTDYVATVGAKKIRDWVKTSYDSQIKNASGGNGDPMQGPNEDALNPIISSNGERIIFTSAASNLVPGDTNGDADAFSTALHNTYTFSLNVSWTNAVSLAYDQLSDSLVIKDGNGLVVASQPVTFAFSGTILMRGRDGVNDFITVDALSLQPLGGNVIIHGGTGTDTIEVIFGTGLGKTDITDVEIRSGYTRVQGHEILDLEIEKEISQELYSITGVDVETINDKTEAAQILVDSDQLTHGVTTSGDNLVVTSGGRTYISDRFVLELDGHARLHLSPGNDSVTIDTSTMPASVPNRLSVFGNGGSDSISAVTYTPPSTGFLLSTDGIPASTSAVSGSHGHDTFIIGGGGTYTGGAGDDEFHVTAQAGYSNFVAVPDTGRNRLVFVSGGYGTVSNLDLQTAQTFAPGRTMTISGFMQDALYGSFDDHVTIKAKSVPRFVDGGDEITGDTLVVDAEGQAATIFEGQVHVKGMAPITYTDIENVVVVNNAPTLQVAAVEINDGEVQRSMVRKIVVGFNTLVTFPSGVSSAIMVTDNATGMPITCTVTPIDADGVTYAVITFPAGAPNYGSLPNGAFKVKLIGVNFSSSLAPSTLDANGDGTVDPGGEIYETPAALIFRTFGDFNGDRTSNLIDFAAFRGVFNLGPSDIFDLEGDGTVGLLDFAGFRDRFNILV